MMAQVPDAIVGIGTILNAGDLATEHNDNEGALREYSAAEKIAATTAGVPQSRYAEMIYWHAVALVNMKRVDEALPLLEKAVALDPKDKQSQGNLKILKSKRKGGWLKRLGILR